MSFYLCLKFPVLPFLLFYLFKLLFCEGRAPSSPVDKNDATRIFMVLRGLDPEFREPLLLFNLITSTE